jgi:hypothetical protein
VKPSELLRRVRAIVLTPGRWVSFDADAWNATPKLPADQPADHCGCVLNHFWRIAGRENMHGHMEGGRMPVTTEVVDTALLAMGGTGTVVWVNDRGPTRLWGVVAMLGKAIRRLEERGE